MGKEFNKKSVKFRLKAEDGEVLIKESAASIIFASIVESDDDGDSFKINSGMAGEFNMKSILRSLEAVTSVAAKAMEEHHGMSAPQFVALMSKVVSRAVNNSFAPQGPNEAVLDAILELIKERIK